MAQFTIKLWLFLIIIILVGAVLVATGWSLWIMFIAWILDRDFDRIIIIATSGFWIGAGGLTWAILRGRNNLNVK